MEQYRDPKTKVHIFGHLIGQGSNVYQQGQDNLINKYAKLIGNLYGIFKKCQCLPKPYTKINSRWTVVLKLTRKTKKFVEDNVRHHYDLKVGKVFLNGTEKMYIYKGNY